MNGYLSWSRYKLRNYVFIIISKRIEIMQYTSLVNDNNEVENRHTAIWSGLCNIYNEAHNKQTRRFKTVRNNLMVLL